MITRWMERLRRALKRTPAEPAQSHAETPAVMPSPATDTPLEPQAPRKKTFGSRQQLETECTQFAFRTARLSGAIEPEEPVAKALDAKATAKAHAVHRAVSEAQQQRRLAQLTTLDETRKRQIVDRDRAAVDLAAAREALGSLGPRPACPSVSTLFVHTVTAALVVAFAPTFHDLLPGLPAFLKWVAGAALALGVSLMIVHGILPGPPDQPQAAQRSRSTFAAALLFGVALLLIRLTMARAFEDLLLSVGLTMAEFAAVWTLERRARTVEDAVAVHLDDATVRDQAENHVAIKAGELARRQAALDRTEATIAEIEAEFEHDHELGDLKALITIAQNACRAGYMAGLSANAGEIGGVTGKEAA
jgi:hypothetical protein